MTDWKAVGGKDSKALVVAMRGGGLNTMSHKVSHCDTEKGSTSLNTSDFMYSPSTSMYFHFRMSRYR